MKNLLFTVLFLFGVFAASAVNVKNESREHSKEIVQDSGIEMTASVEAEVNKYSEAAEEAAVSVDSVIDWEAFRLVVQKASEEARQETNAKLQNRFEELFNEADKAFSELYEPLIAGNDSDTIKALKEVKIQVRCISKEQVKTNDQLNPVNSKLKFEVVNQQNSGGYFKIDTGTNIELNTVNQEAAKMIETGGKYDLLLTISES